VLLTWITFIKKPAKTLR